jgi:hypothetical protein
VDEERSGPRPGWVRDVELPRDRDELRGPTSGVVRLPLRIHWSGPDPQGVEWHTRDDLHLPPWLTEAWDDLIECARRDRQESR